jgi:YjbE family integral membrane protein
MELNFVSPQLVHEGTAILQIVFINVLLGGDNAIAIAMACRSLPARQRRLGVWIGTSLGIVLRLAMIYLIGFLLAIPYMHVIAALLLVWIGIQLLRTDDGGGETSAGRSTALWRAIVVILFADLSMSLDNGLATAAIAEALPESSRILVVLAGLAAGAPVIALGSTLMLKLLGKFPLLTYAGAALLGWIAGEMLLADSQVSGALQQTWAAVAGDTAGGNALRIALCVLVAAVVPLAGRLGMRRQCES